MKYLNKLALFAAFVFLFAGCEDTNVDLVGSRGIAVVPVVSDISPDTYSLSLENLSTEVISFTVDLADGETVNSAKIEVRYKDKIGLLEEIQSFPAEISITGAEILQSLGIEKSEASLGTSFYIYVLTTSKDVTTRSTATVVMSLPCEYVASKTVGGYKVVSEDWEIESNVDFIADPNDQYKIHIKGLAKADKLTSNGNDMIIDIDPNTFEITSDKIILAADCSGWGSDFAGYTNYSYKVTSGQYNSCTGNYEIVFDISVDQGGWGNNVFVFTK